MKIIQIVHLTCQMWPLYLGNTNSHFQQCYSYILLIIYVISQGEHFWGDAGSQSFVPYLLLCCQVVGGTAPSGDLHHHAAWCLHCAL